FCGVEHGKQPTVSGVLVVVCDAVCRLDRSAYCVARSDGVGTFSGSHICGGARAGDRDAAQYETLVAVVFGVCGSAWAEWRGRAVASVVAASLYQAFAGVLQLCA